MKKAGLLLALAGSLLINGCSVKYYTPPGHDPAGPGNSENAPGHNKKYLPSGQTMKLKMPPGQAKKYIH